MDDVIIIGGSFAGLIAASHLVRARRKVTIFDTNRPRNRYARAAHNVLGYDGVSPLDIRRKALADVLAYPTARHIEAEITGIGGIAGDFAVRTLGGEAFGARRILLSYGVTDHFPEIPGFAECWGNTVIHCPYCHGYEVGGGPVGVIARTADAARFATIVADWGDVTLFTNETQEPDEAAPDLLRARGVKLRPGRVTAIEDGPAGMLSVETGPGIPGLVKALFVMPEARVRSTIPDDRGLTRKETPIGPIIETGETGETSLKGLYAAGDIALGAANISFASANGVKAGVMLHHSLIWDAH